MIQGIIEILTLNSGVRSAVGRNAANNKYKIYPVIAPQTEDTPYVVCALTGTTPAFGKGCVSTLDTENFDVLIYSKSYEQGYNIDVAIRRALDGANGNTDDTDIHFANIWFVSRRDAAVEGKEGTIYVKVVSYSAEVAVHDVVEA